MRAALVSAVLLAALPRATVAQDAGPAPEPSAAAAPAPSAEVPPAPSAEVAPAPSPAPAVPGGPAAPAAATPTAKSGGYFGFSFGTGRGEVFVGDTTTSVEDMVPGVSPTTLSLMLRAGWASGDLLFGFQLNLTRSQWDVSGVSSAMQLAAFDVVTTWRSSELGLYVRAGVGPAQLTFEGGGASESYNGTEAMLGVGFGAGGFGVGFDYVRQSYGSEAPIDGAGYVLATVSLDFG
jgi:hypothetical protein